VGRCCITVSGRTTNIATITSIILTDFCTGELHNSSPWCGKDAASYQIHSYFFNHRDNEKGGNVRTQEKFRTSNMATLHRQQFSGSQSLRWHQCDNNVYKWQRMWCECDTKKKPGLTPQWTCQLKQQTRPGRNSTIEIIQKLDSVVKVNACRTCRVCGIRVKSLPFWVPWRSQRVTWNCM